MGAILILAAAAVVGAVQPTVGGQVKSGLVASPVRAGAASAALNIAGLIEGQVLNPDRTPLAFARVRLRNLDTGTILERKTSDHLGEFSFVVARRGTYIAEHFGGDNDQVLASSEALIVEAGQTVGALILLPARAPSLAGLFGNSAAAIVSAAAGAGITAVTSTGNPVSPEQ